MLVTREEVRHRSVIARTLDVVVSAQRVCARARSHVITRNQKQVGDRRGRIGSHAVLRDSHRPEDADAFRFGDQTRHLFQRLDG